jgi:hypothetical protein
MIDHGGYDLDVPDELSVTINPTLVRQWRIFGYADRHGIAERNVETLPEAFRNAEQFVDLVLSDEKRASLKQRRLNAA